MFSTPITHTDTHTHSSLTHLDRPVVADVWNIIIWASKLTISLFATSSAFAVHLTLLSLSAPRLMSDIRISKLAEWFLDKSCLGTLRLSRFPQSSALSFLNVYFVFSTGKQVSISSYEIPHH